LLYIYIMAKVTDYINQELIILKVPIIRHTKNDIGANQIEHHTSNIDRKIVHDKGTMILTAKQIIKKETIKKKETESVRVQFNIYYNKVKTVENITGFQENDFGIYKAIFTPHNDDNIKEFSFELINNPNHEGHSILPSLKTYDDLLIRYNNLLISYDNNVKTFSAHHDTLTILRVPITITSETKKYLDDDDGGGGGGGGGGDTVGETDRDIDRKGTMFLNARTENTPVVFQIQYISNNGSNRIFSRNITGFKEEHFGIYTAEFATPANNGDNIKEFSFELNNPNHEGNLILPKLKTYDKLIYRHNSVKDAIEDVKEKYIDDELIILTMRITRKNNMLNSTGTMYLTAKEIKDDQSVGYTVDDGVGYTVGDKVNDSVIFNIYYKSRFTGSPKIVAEDIDYFRVILVDADLKLEQVYKKDSANPIFEFIVKESNSDKINLFESLRNRDQLIDQYKYVKYREPIYLPYFYLGGTRQTRKKKKTHKSRKTKKTHKSRKTKKTHKSRKARKAKKTHRRRKSRRVNKTHKRK
jgi:hypothetical protein